MKKLLAFLLIAGVPILGYCDDPPVKTEPGSTVTIASKGDDVRAVLHDLFVQTKKNYVLDPNVRHQLYLALTGVEFEEALQIVCKIADLQYEIQNGIYYVNKIKSTKLVSKSGGKSDEPKAVDPPKGRLPYSILTKRVTTKMSKADLRVVIAEIAKQTKINIVVDAGVPLLKLDAYLINTSLKYALDTLSKAAGLKYTFTESMSILIEKDTANRVSVVGSG